MKRTRISAYVGRAAFWLNLLVLTACRPQAFQDGKSVLMMIRATGVNPAQFTGNPRGGAGIGSMMVFAAEGLYQFSRMTDESSPRLAKRIWRVDGPQYRIAVKPFTVRSLTWRHPMLHDKEE